MIASYHTHSFRCLHANGEDEEYVKAAIAEGIKILGFSDHAPIPYTNGYKSGIRMTPDETDGYFSSIISLREKYADKIAIHIGFEAEYYEPVFSMSLELWKKYPVEYLLLGQHFIGPEYKIPQHTAPSRTTEKEHLAYYVDSVIAALDTGRFTYVAHPDMINYVGEDIDFCRAEFDRLIEAISSRGMPLEYNLLGMSLGRNYPNELFWQEVSRLGAPVIFGCDSHSPSRVANKDELCSALKFVNKYNLNLVDTVKLVSPFTPEKNKEK